MARSAADARPVRLREFFPGNFALVMATGIVSIAARRLGYEAAGWPLLVINLGAYPVLWLILLARIARLPRRRAA